MKLSLQFVGRAIGKLSMTEAIKIVIEADDGRGGHLPARDALNQVLDSLTLVTDAIDEDVRKDLDCRLIEMTMNSRLVASMEPFSKNPNRPDIVRAVRKATDRADGILRMIVETHRMPSGISLAEKETVKRLFMRNTNGVLRTDYYWLGREDPVSISPPVAKRFLEEMSGIESEGSIAFQGTELGSIEGDVIEAFTHYGKPAVKIRHRVSEQEITCVIPANREDEIGNKHSWNEAWEGHRYVVTGEIKRKANGDIAQLLVGDIRSVKVEDVDLDKIADPDFTGGKSPVEYLNDLWGE